jgi:retron-type reverse transcriptase
MKRVGNLWDQLVSFPNLLRAARKARKGKRDRKDVAAFEYDVERELIRIRDELQAGAYPFGSYHTFTITEPKPRLISAAPYRDRVVHHALCNVLEPVYERSFISDSYACRTDKGTHAAVRRCHEFAGGFSWVLKADIRKFFPSIDHDILKSQLARKIKDRRVLELAGRIIDHSNEQEPVIEHFPGDHLFTYDERRHGLPIGNQTSQFFGNVYLDALDHFVKDRLRVRGYVRYVDDFTVFGHDKRELVAARDGIAEFLETLRLRLHPDKTMVFPTAQGIRFLGYRVFGSHVRLARESVVRFRRRIRDWRADANAGCLDRVHVRKSVSSWLGHAVHAATSRLRERMLGECADALKPVAVGRR